MSKERPILFSGPMVRALLDGSKTQTRRMVKPQPTEFVGGPGVTLRDGSPAPLVPLDDSVEPYGREIVCPYGQPGDQLWVRETFRGCRAYEVQGYAPKDWGNKPIWFEADGTAPGRPEQWALRSRPSIHMPRWASRITLEITRVRVERLQDISEADALAEGIERPESLSAEEMKALDIWDGAERACFNALNQPVHQYRRLWDQINGPDSWTANPWVWVVEFRRLP